MLPAPLSFSSFLVPLVAQLPVDTAVACLLRVRTWKLITIRDTSLDIPGISSTAEGGKGEETR